MSISVVAVITAKEGSADVVRGALQDLVGPTRQEDGCLSYGLSESAAVPGVFVTVEEWTEQAALDAHLQTEHIATALATADGHLTEAPQIHPLTPVDVPGQST